MAPSARLQKQEGRIAELNTGVSIALPSLMRLAMDKPVHPSKEQVRRWMTQRQSSRCPPDPRDIRRALGWDSNQPVSKQTVSNYRSG